MTDRMIRHGSRFVLHFARAARIVPVACTVSGVRMVFAACLVPVACLVFAASCIDRPEPIRASGSEASTARLVFIGDVMSHSPQVAGARTPDGGYDYTGVFRHFRPIFDGNGRGNRRNSDVCAHIGNEPTCADSPETVTIANLETTLRTSPPYTGYPMFSAPAELVFAMRDAGIDIATTANNHICDKGAAGIRSTLALLDSAGIRHTGAFLDSTDRRARNPLRFTSGDMRFALFTYTYGTNGMPVPKGMMVNLIDTAVIARDLAAARAEDTDCVIVSYHWGEEYRSQPVRSQRELAEWTRARGADLIIGGHPHVVEPMEAHYNADSTAVVGATFYSLGNFVSNQRRRYTDGGIAAEITVTRPLVPAVAAYTSYAPDALYASASSQPTFQLGWRLAWVHTFLRDGAMRYEVLPAAALGSLSSADPEYHLSRRFVRDTRRLLSTVDTVFVELQ